MSVNDEEESVRLSDCVWLCVSLWLYAGVCMYLYEWVWESVFVGMCKRKEKEMCVNGACVMSWIYLLTQ